MYYSFILATTYLANASSSVANTGISFDQAHKVASFLLSLIVFLYGVLKVENLLKTYKKNKLGATFNFYTNMNVLIWRLYLSISLYDGEPDYEPKTRGELKKGKPSKILRYIWGDCTIENLEGSIRLLSELVTDFLRFISTSRDQIPPGITKEALTEWNFKKNKLTYFLTELMPDEPLGFSDGELIEKHNELTDILDYFLGKIEDAYFEYVTEAGAGIVLSNKTLCMESGATTRLTYTTNCNKDFKEVTWKSSNLKVVEVDANGVLEAVGVGSATVTARVTASKRWFAKRKKITSCQVTVSS